MKALMLAAGSGRRLGTADALPKALLRFGDHSLLERHIDILRQCGIDSMVLAVGYRSEDLAAEIQAIGADNFVTMIFNPQFERGSVTSLWALRETLNEGNDVLLMDADVLYDARMVRRLIETDVGNCFLVDRDLAAGDEPVKVCIDNGSPVEFRKVVDPNIRWDTQGESVGFFRISGTTAPLLARQCGKYIIADDLDQHYEEAIRDLLLDPDAPSFGYEDVTGIPWIEIDFPEDIERATREILPQL